MQARSAKFHVLILFVEVLDGKLQLVLWQTLEEFSHQLMALQARPLENSTCLTIRDNVPLIMHTHNLQVLTNCSSSSWMFNPNSSFLSHWHVPIAVAGGYSYFMVPDEL